MTDISAKVAHVKAADQTRKHHCHWPGCNAEVPPAKWGCKKHWYTLPDDIRRRIWRAYRPGQEEDDKPSTEYMKVAAEARQWAEEYNRRTKTPTLL